MAAANVAGDGGCGAGVFHGRERHLLQRRGEGAQVRRWWWCMIGVAPASYQTTCPSFAHGRRQHGLHS